MIYETRINLRNKTKEELILFVNEGLETIRKYEAELEKKEAIMNEMAKHIHLSGDYECLNKECEDDESKDCEECIKEYFTNKVEKEGIKE